MSSRPAGIPIKRIVSALAALLLFAPIASGAARIDPSFRFRTLETEHFSVHFHQGLDEIAAKAARLAEKAHRELSGQFGWEPREKTQVVLVDGSDFANGFTVSLPYNAMYLYVVPPSLDMTTGEYEDWLEVLIVHEYSHVLTNDPSRGYSKVTRKIFGKPVPSENPFSLLVFLFSAPPNTFLPRWWHEGMATWAETEDTKVGRGRSATYEMILRMAVEENNLPTIDQANEDLPYWPDGHIPYIYGLRLAKYVADRYGEEAAGALSLAHAGRPPYFLNGAAQNLFGGKSYKKLYYEMIEELKKEEGAQARKLREVPLTPVRLLDLSGERLTNPRFSPDGSRIAFHRTDPHGHEAIVVADKDGNNAREAVRRLPSDHAIAWSPDSGTLYFCQAEVTGFLNVYQDLYSHDLRSGKTRRLTKGLRVREPDLSPDGRAFAVVVGGRGSQNLALLSPAEGGDAAKSRNHVLAVLTEYRQVRVSGPRWSPDGKRIAFVLTGNDGRSGLYLYDLQEKSARRLFEDDHSVGYPAWSRDGRHLLYSADSTGVYNLWAYSVADGKRFQVTHLLGGAFQPDVGAGGRSIVFSSYGSRGFRLAEIDYDPNAWRSSPGPSIEPYWNAGRDRPTEAATADKIAAGGASKAYSPLPTLAPRFWLPTLSGDHEGVVAGAFTAGQDVLGYAAYRIELDYGAESGRLYYNAAFLYDRFAPTFRVQAYSLPVLYSDLLRRGDYYELNRSVVLEMTYPVFFIESEYRFSLGYRLQRQDALSDLSPRGEFDGLPVFQGRRDNLFARLAFSNALKYPYSISHEERRTLSFEFRNYSKSLGSDLSSREWTGSYKEYFRLPWQTLRHHVAYLNLNGGVAAGDRTVQQAFQLGGPPSELTAFPLRGYPSRFETGKYIATGTLEYRAPIRNVFRGPGTVPLFLDRLHGAVFADAGEVWGDSQSFSSDQLRIGAGFEVRADVTLGYWVEITPALGIAHGFNRDGENSVYFTIYTNL